MQLKNSIVQINMVADGGTIVVRMLLLIVLTNSLVKAAIEFIGMVKPLIQYLLK